MTFHNKQMPGGCKIIISPMLIQRPLSQQLIKRSNNDQFMKRPLSQQLLKRPKLVDKSTQTDFNIAPLDRLKMLRRMRKQAMNKI